MEQLAPVLDADALPAETMAAQVTRLGGGGGGVAVGVALHHAVVDGRSVWRFIEAWAACCRGDDAWSAAPAPAFDRAAVALPDGEELARDVLRKYVPNLPVVSTQIHRISLNSIVFLKKFIFQKNMFKYF